MEDGIPIVAIKEDRIYVNETAHRAVLAREISQAFLNPTIGPPGPYIPSDIQRTPDGVSFPYQNSMACRDTVMRYFGCERDILQLCSEETIPPAVWNEFQTIVHVAPVFGQIIVAQAILNEHHMRFLCKGLITDGFLVHVLGEDESDVRETLRKEGVYVASFVPQARGPDSELHTIIFHNGSMWWSFLDSQPKHVYVHYEPRKDDKKVVVRCELKRSTFAPFEESCIWSVILAKNPYCVGIINCTPALRRKLDHLSGWAAFESSQTTWFAPSPECAQVTEEQWENKSKSVYVGVRDCYVSIVTLDEKQLNSARG